MRQSTRINCALVFVSLIVLEVYCTGSHNVSITICYCKIVFTLGVDKSNLRRLIHHTLIGQIFVDFSMKTCLINQTRKLDTKSMYRTCGRGHGWVGRKGILMTKFSGRNKKNSWITYSKSYRIIHGR